MFKSVFSRIMSTFTIIILCCLLVLVFVMSSSLLREGQDRELQELQIAATEVACYLQNIQSFTLQPPELLLTGDSFRRNLDDISRFAESDMLVLRKDGSVVISANEAFRRNSYLLDEETVADITEQARIESNKYTVSDLNGALAKTSLNRFAIITDKNGELLYLIVATGSTKPEARLFLSVTKRIAVAAIWIFFAALICASLVSRRITDPLKQISETSKQYAQGHFSARVKVDGQDEIAELGKAFNNMARSLADMEDNRNTFLSNVSHDLRTPMTTISGFVDGMLDGTIPPDQYERYLQTISGEVRRLSRLVNTLLEISRLESGRALVTSEFNLTEKARQVLISLVGKIDAKKIDVEFEGGDEDVYVLANPDSIHQVLYNLLDNAAKFTNVGGKISISITPIRGKKASVKVRNSGDGIPEEELSHIFERFYKSDRSRGLDKTGTGLGLYIVKTILEKHGELITVSSKVGEFTEFSFTLSLVPSHKAHIPDADFVPDESDDPRKQDVGDPFDANERKSST